MNNVLFVVYAASQYNPNFPIEGRYDFNLAYHIGSVESEEVLFIGWTVFDQGVVREYRHE